MRIFALFFLCALLGCSSKRSAYEPYEHQEGYRDSKAKGMRTASFRGNSVTKIKDAELFATFRAIEVCLGEKKAIAHILDVRSKTKKKDIIRTTGAGYSPSYYYGMSPFYGRYSSYGMGFGTSSGSAWKETLILPEIEVSFECTDQAWGPEVVFRNISAETMKLLVKDLKGGLQVEKFLDGSPNSKNLEVGDIVLKMNGERIEKSWQIQRAFNLQPRSVTFELDILREGEKKKVKLISTEITSAILKRQKEIITLACGYEDLKERELCKD